MLFTNCSLRPDYIDRLPQFCLVDLTPSTCKLDVAHLLTKLCTNQDNVLPQGSPASPAISNYVLFRLDCRLGRLAESLGGSYSRYADDITFSGEKSIKSAIPLIIEIINDEGYMINEKKTRLQYSNTRQEVTGLVVNKKLSVSKTIESEIKNAVYYIRKYGIDNHMDYIHCEKLFYKDHIYGIAYFIKMVDSSKGDFYLKELDSINWN